jgi:integrase
VRWRRSAPQTSFSRGVRTLIKGARKKSRRRHNVGSVSLKKKTGLYYAVINHRTAGKRDRRWSRGYKTAEEAEAALRKMLDEKRPSRSTKSNIGSIVDSYIARRADEGLSPTTLQRYRGIARLNLVTIRDERLEALDDERIEDLHEALRRSGLSPTSIFHVHSLLTAAIRWATRSRDTPFSVRAPSRSKSAVRALSFSDAAKLLQEIGASERGNAVLFSLGTGMRRGEIAGLRTPSLDLQRGVVVVCESRYQITGKHDQKKTKSERVREVALSDLARDVLQREEKRQAAWKERAGEMWIDSGHVFTDECGAALSPYGLSAAFRLIAEKAKITGYTLHGLRHTFATWLLSSGVDVGTVSALLGHSVPSTTLNIYGHVVLEQRDAVRVIDRLLPNSGS